MTVAVGVLIEERNVASLLAVLITVVPIVGLGITHLWNAQKKDRETWGSPYKKKKSHKH